ncbi:MAG TPA: thiamine-phosphate kinase [Candidatus Eremiobacteraceae bacterium]|nr:thiamine-phosphate kinase [Candidatus Eremiobacteraceae bacterium]
MRSIAPPPLREDSLIAMIAAACGAPSRPLRVGIGDDAAAWKPNPHHLALVTTDMIVDDVHFRTRDSSAALIGRKALAKSLSDIAAMGGRPVLAVIALGVTAELDEAWYRSFYEGMNELARATHCAIAGGDIVRTPALTIGVTVIGEVRKTSMRLRSGAKAGDVIAVTGALGLAAAGLRALDSPTGRDRAKDAIDAYERPQPRIDEGVFLGSRRAVHALMDISDGLSTDVRRMARASKVDAVIEGDALYVHPALRDAGGEALDLILNGGDDYELIASIDKRAFDHVARSFKSRAGRPLRAIGRFEPGQGDVWLDRNGKREPLEPGGYDHFKRLHD